MIGIESIEALEALYGTPKRAALDNVVDRLKPLYRRWIGASRFCILGQNRRLGPRRRRASGANRRRPDAAAAGLARQRPDRLLWNIVADGRVSAMFLVPGSGNVVRGNGRAWLTADPGVLAGFDREGRLPRSVAVVEVAEVYFQCAIA